MKRGKARLLGIAWFSAMLVILSVMLTASYYLTGYLYRLTHLNPPILVTQIVNSLLGLLLVGLTISASMKIASLRGWLPERNVFAPIVDALERIAKGDFRVRLENGPQDNQMVSVLANSVNRMALELEQMENLRQEFISNVSHEIQSPLTSIRGFAQALQNDQLSQDERHHYLSIIESESTRLSRITEDLLRLAALDSEHARFEPKPYRLDRQIRSLVLACEPQWSAKALEINASLDPLEITADEDLLSQVWTNLLHNGIKFTPPGGQICISLRRLDTLHKEGNLRQQADTVEFKIQDSGIGVSAEDQARIFERFYKADRSRTQASGGSGLGLAIAKKIVEMHHGEIGVESAPGSGTTFTVRLPIV